MTPLKSILIIILLSLRMLHGIDIDKFSSILLQGSELEEISMLKCRNSQLNAPHAKKKVRINCSAQERKNKYQAANTYSPHLSNFILAADLAYSSRNSSYIQKSAFLSNGCHSFLHLLNPF